MPSNVAFGRILRAEREGRGVTMGQLARHLKVSVPYISDVERGNRPPLTISRIYDACEFLEITPDRLLGAASHARGQIVLDASTLSEKGQQVGIALMRGWARLTDEDFDKIGRILGHRMRGNHARARG